MLSSLVIGMYLTLTLGCGTEFDAELEQQVVQSEFEMRESPEPDLKGQIIIWNQIIDCKAEGMASCQECGAGDDGVICCIFPPCKVVNKPKSVSSAASSTGSSLTQD